MTQHLLQHLIELETELHHDGHLCAPDRLQQLLHPQFEEVGKSGLRYSRETVIGYLAGLGEAPPAESYGHSLQDLGEGCALLLYESAQRLNGEVVRALRSSVWQRQDGCWRLRYHQGTPV